MDQFLIFYGFSNSYMYWLLPQWQIPTRMVVKHFVDVNFLGFENENTSYISFQTTLYFFYNIFYFETSRVCDQNFFITVKLSTNSFGMKINTYWFENLCDWWLVFWFSKAKKFTSTKCFTIIIIGIYHCVKDNVIFKPRGVNLQFWHILKTAS